MVDTRKSSGVLQAEKPAQATEPVEAETAPPDTIQQLCRAAVRLRRTIPESEISDDDAKKILRHCDLDVKRAVAVIKSKAPVLIDDEASDASSAGAVASVQRDGNVLKRKAADFS